MAEQIRVAPEKLRAAAAHHQEAAEYLATVPSSHGEVQASLDSLGPVYGGLAEAGRQLLEERRQCYERQAADHAEMALNLTAAAARWEHSEQDSAAELRAVVDDQ